MQFKRWREAEMENAVPFATCHIKHLSICGGSGTKMLHVAFVACGIKHLSMCRKRKRERVILYYYIYYNIYNNIIYIHYLFTCPLENMKTP